MTTGEPDAPAVGSWAGAGAVHEDLLVAKALVYDRCGFTCSRPVAEAESAEYGAYEFTLDGLRVTFRAARTTPTKAGQFVTVWKRSDAGPIRPFDVGDPVDLVVVSARDGDRFGQFVFPRDVLRARGILSVNGAGGKRAFRVYPPWVAVESRQARGTQAWQAACFLDVGTGTAIDLARARALHHPA
ncbi:MepB family protein [Streptomyces sp. NBC_01233]|uniref:MepB family protein n=1 Tax=Streptomyces sp. NBC_01233 TaxID=2903787 RepID=UPI002E11F18C|nr:MepB family protein [Streptomyces sp. NBC_01233]